MSMSKDEIITAIRECTEKLGRCPTVPQLKKMKGVGLRTIRRYFGGYSEAVREAGFDPQGQGFRLSVDKLLEDWVRVSRHLGKIPTLPEYGKLGRYSVGPLITRFGGWSEVPDGMRRMIEGKAGERAHEDVLEMIKMADLKLRKRPSNSNAAGTNCKVAKPRPDRPVYGSPLVNGMLAFAPTNEIGVVCLFGMLARELGLVVLRIQTEYPDGEVMRAVEGGKWQRLHVEFEYQSRNFLLHLHDPKQCDMIVCWEHNWPECPEEIEVLELKEVLAADQRR
jgi:Homing endonuclease associated repeat